MREHLTRALQKSNYEVVSVDRGTAAIPYLESERFDSAPDRYRHARNGMELSWLRNVAESLLIHR